MKYTCLILLWSLFATMALPADNLIQSISIVPCPESITPVQVILLSPEKQTLR